MNNECCCNCSYYYEDYGQPCCKLNDITMPDPYSDSCEDFREIEDIDYVLEDEDEQ